MLKGFFRIIYQTKDREMFIVSLHFCYKSYKQSDLNAKL